MSMTSDPYEQRVQAEKARDDRPAPPATSPLLASPFIPPPEPRPISQPVFGENGLADLVKGMVGVMRKAKSIAKAGYNREGKYNYVYYGDLLAILQDALASEGLFISHREVNRLIYQKIMFITYEFDVYHQHGGWIRNICSHTGSCRFEFAKGGTDDKATNKCLVGAQKYALTSMFKIPPDDHHIDDRIDDGDVDAQGPSWDPERNRDADRRDDRRDDRRPALDGPERDRRDDRRPALEGPPDDRREPPRDDRRDDRGPPDDRRWPDHTEDVPPLDGPPPDPPPYDDAPPPYGGAGRVNDPPSSPEDAKFRDQVAGLKKKIMDAPDENEAERIWIEHKDLMPRMVDPVYDHLYQAYLRRWGNSPPKA